MEKKNDSLRERLLARLPKPENYAAYQEEVAAGIAKNEKRLRRTQWMAKGLWIYVVVLIMLLIGYRGEKWLATPRGHAAEFAGLFLVIYGAMVMVEYFIRKSQIEIMKEIKQVQLQVLELQTKLEKTQDHAS